MSTQKKFAVEDGPDIDPAGCSRLLTTHYPSTKDWLSDKQAADEAYACYEKTWDMAHLDDAVGLFQRAIDAVSEPKANLLGRLGQCLGIRYQVQGKLDDLERGIAVDEDALQLTSDEHPDKILQLNNLSFSLTARYKRLGDLADFERAMTMQQRSVTLTPDGHPYMPGSLDNLGNLYRLRYERFGDLDDLENSVANHQRAIELALDDRPDRPECKLINLGFSLRVRFERLGEPDDLERAIAVLRSAIEFTPEGHPELATCLNNLAVLQLLRFNRFGDPKDLERAIAGQQHAVELTPDGHFDKAVHLNGLGVFLHARFELTDKLDDLERAITVGSRAVELTPERHPNMSIRLSNLGSFQEVRYWCLGDLEDLNCAIANQRQAIALTPDDHPEKHMRFRNLALSLVAYLRRERAAENFSKALFCYMAATSQSMASPNNRLTTATCAVKLLNDFREFSTPENLILAHSRVVDILPEIVWPGHSLTRRLDESKRLGELVNAAVCAAIGAGAVENAVEWLDAGRGLIWTQALSLRDPLDELAQLHPDLARSLNDVHGRLQSSMHAASHRDSNYAAGRHALPIPTFSSDADRHRATAIEYGKLIEDIRDRPGLENFMRPKKLSALLPTSTVLNGAVIFINVDQTHCDALILQRDGFIVPVALPELSLHKAEALRRKWQSYLHQQKVRERSMSTQSLWPPSDASDAIKILGHIWEWVVRPVLAKLGLTGVESDCEHLPHVTWCPTGPLTQLPLHAAGLYTEALGPYVYDFVVSSYTTSLSSLTRSIDALAKQRATSGVLVVTQPSTPGFQPLPGTTIEGKCLREVFSGIEATLSVFDAELATTVAIKRTLSANSWLHLACHGSQDLADPLQSAFALYDGPLTLSDLMSTTADQAELAFLSACQTAVGDEKIPEESMHLAAGMLAVGYKGVIATMWSIRDDDAPLVVEAYYKKLLELRESGTLGKDETGAAYALHEATKRLREHVGEMDVVRWAPFVHFGI